MRNYTKKEVEAAVIDSKGLISTVAKRLGCHWHTAESYIKKYELDNFMKFEKESLKDFTESQLIKNIAIGREASIIFFLKTQAKDRGYIERSEVTGKDGEPVRGIEFVIVSPDKDKDGKPLKARKSRAVKAKGD